MNGGKFHEGTEIQTVNGNGEECMEEERNPAEKPFQRYETDLNGSSIISSCYSLVNGNSPSH